MAAGPRLTKGKVERWKKDLDKIQELYERVSNEVREQASNPISRHATPLYELKSDLALAGRRIEIARKSADQLRP